MDPIFEAYLEAQRRRRASPLTLKAARHALAKTQRWLDERAISPAELTLLECEQYFGELLERYALSTVRRHLAYVRAAYRYGIRHDLVERDPTADVKLPWLPDIEPATYTNDELRAIHTAITDEREDLAFHLLAFAGLRLGEAAGLHWHDLDLDKAQIQLTGKGGKFRLVPLHPVLQAVLREKQPCPRFDHQALFVTRKGTGLVATTLGRALRTLVDRADVEVDLPAHAFRRTVATVMYENGVRTRVIERIMGWAPRQMHERHYFRVAEQPMHDAIRTLYSHDPICDRQHTAHAIPSPTLATERAASHIDETTRSKPRERQILLRTELIAAPRALHRRSRPVSNGSVQL